MCVSGVPISDVKEAVAELDEKAFTLMHPAGEGKAELEDGTVPSATAPGFASEEDKTRMMSFFSR